MPCLGWSICAISLSFLMTPQCLQVSSFFSGEDCTLPVHTLKFPLKSRASSLILICSRLREQQLQENLSQRTIQLYTSPSRREENSTCIMPYHIQYTGNLKITGSGVECCYKFSCNSKSYLNSNLPVGNQLLREHFYCIHVTMKRSVSSAIEYLLLKALLF